MVAGSVPSRAPLLFRIVGRDGWIVAPGNGLAARTVTVTVWPGDTAVRGGRWWR